MMDPYLFKCQVIRVNLTRPNDPTNYTTMPGTVDCICEPPRMPLRNVRILVPNSTLTYSYGNNDTFTNVNGTTAGLNISLTRAGFWHMPNVGDWIVVGFLNGYPDFGVCLGSILPTHDPTINLPADPNDTFVGSDGQTHQYGFKRQDAIWFHETGSFLRFRNLAVKQQFLPDISGTLQWTYVWDGIALIPELKLQHGSGTNITFSQDANKNVTTSFTHVSNGTTESTLTIDPNGNIVWGTLGNFLLQSTLNPTYSFVDANGDIIIRDKYSNQIALNSQGITFTNTIGQTNSITMGSSGVQVTTNVISLQSSGGYITVSDSGVDINAGLNPGAAITLNGGLFPVLYSIDGSAVNSFSDIGVSTSVFLGR